MLLEIEGLTARYGRVNALRGVDIFVGDGELVALVGANGAGKSTLMRVISGIQPATGGTVRFDGKDITRMTPDKRVRLGIAQVPEGRQVFAPMSVEDNLNLGAYTRPRGELGEDMDKVYNLFPALLELRHLAAGKLSGGQQQMLAIGRALMARPRLLLLDEPSMGLSPILVDQTFETIRDLARSGTTIFLVEQNAYVALSIADRGYVMEGGRTTLSGKGADLLDNDDVKKAYLGI